MTIKFKLIRFYSIKCLINDHLSCHCCPGRVKQSQFFLSVIVSVFLNYRNTDYLVEIIFIFVRCRRIYSALAPSKYECDANDPTTTLEISCHFFRLLFGGIASDVRLWISNHIRCFMWNVITDPYRNFNFGRLQKYTHDFTCTLLITWLTKCIYRYRLNNMAIPIIRWYCVTTVLSLYDSL